MASTYTQIVDVSIPINVNTSSGPLVDGSMITSPTGVQRYRQRCNISDPTDPNAHAYAVNSDPGADAYGLVVRNPTSLEILTVLQNINRLLDLLTSCILDTDYQPELVEGDS